MPHPLQDVTIALPCQADWNLMQGDEQVRFCGECQLNVYNLSGMSRDAAEALILNTEGRLCVRFFQRSDGTVITQDCPVGLRAIYKKKTTRLSRVAAVITLVTVMGSFCVSYAEKAKTGATVSASKQQQHEPKRILMGKPMMYLPSQDPKMGDVATPPKNPPVMGEMVTPPPNVMQGGLAPMPPAHGEKGQTKKKKTHVEPKGKK